MEKSALDGYMEFTSTLASHPLDADLRQLLEAMQSTQIHTFGWPIGAVLTNDEYRPKPSEDGIQSEINLLADPPGSMLHGYDYWALRRDGTFHLLSSLFEDRRRPEPRSLFIDTRVVRTTEVFLRTGRLYEALGVPSRELVGCRIEYGGLKGRVLGVANPMRMPLVSPPKCSGNKMERVFQLSVSDLLAPASLKKTVHDTVRGITELCDFYEPRRELTDEIVDAFLQGRVT